jgi:hypothetical protein
VIARQKLYKNGAKVQWVDTNGDEPVERRGTVIEDGMSVQYLIAEAKTGIARFVFKDDRTVKEIT